MEKNRVEAFGDGVIAIVITLLVLEIHVLVLSLQHGEHALIQALWQLVPKLGAYLTSFLILAVWWVAHHQLFHTIERVTRNLLWFNNLFPLWLCLLPFPTALIGNYPTARTAAFLYGAVGTLTAGTFLWMRWYVCGRGGLLRPQIPQPLARRALRKSFVSPVAHGCGTAVAVFAPTVAIGICAAVALFYVLPSATWPDPTDPNDTPDGGREMQDPTHRRGRSNRGRRLTSGPQTRPDPSPASIFKSLEFRGQIT
jgi:uncharacterized membrane protein